MLLLTYPLADAPDTADQRHAFGPVAGRRLAGKLVRLGGASAQPLAPPCGEGTPASCSHELPLSTGGNDIGHQRRTGGRVPGSACPVRASRGCGNTSVTPLIITYSLIHFLFYKSISSSLKRQAYGSAPEASWCRAAEAEESK